MVCVCVPLLLKRNVGVLFRVLKGQSSDVPFFFNLLWVCNYIMGIFVYSSLYFSKIGWDGMGCISLAQHRDQWRTLVNKVMNLRIP
jgi:hypothetical protein